MSHVQNRHLSITIPLTIAKNAHGTLVTITKHYNAKISAYQHKFICHRKIPVLTLKIHAHMRKFTHKDKINVSQQTQHAQTTNFTTNNKENVSLLHHYVSLINIMIRH